jgi:hypothetical protein
LEKILSVGTEHRVLEEEVGSQRSLSTKAPEEGGAYPPKPPKKGELVRVRGWGGAFIIKLVARAIFQPVALDLGLSMQLSSLLLSGASGVAEACLARSTAVVTVR